MLILFYFVRKSVQYRIKSVFYSLVGTLVDPCSQLNALKYQYGISVLIIESALNFIITPMLNECH